MISRSELIDFANQRGHTISEEQVRTWHQLGILPTPIRSDTHGKPGSVWLYPVSTKETLLLAVTSDQTDKLDGLLLDVWLRGGDVDIERVRKVLLGIAQPIERFVRNTGLAIEKLARFWTKHVKTHRVAHALSDPGAVMTMMNVAVNVLSPNEDDVIWDYKIDEDPDESPAGLADRLFGAKQLRELSPSAYSETPEQWLNEAKSKLNASRCVDSLKQATSEDFERTRAFVPVMEDWVDGISELMSVIPGEGSAFALIRALKLSKSIQRTMYSIVLLTLYNDTEGRQWILDAIDAWTPHLPRLDAQKRYLRHMKKHPKLSRRKRWVEYFGTCPTDVLDNIRAHHERYFDENPGVRLLVLQEKADTTSM